MGLGRWGVLRRESRMLVDAHARKGCHIFTLSHLFVLLIHAFRRFISTFMHSLHARPSISSEIFAFSLMKYFKYFPNIFAFVIWIKIWCSRPMKGLQDQIYCLVFPLNLLVKYLKYFIKY